MVHVLYVRQKMKIDFPKFFIVSILALLDMGLIAIIAFTSMWGRKVESSHIRSKGPFAEAFRDLYGGSPGSMTEYRSEKLEIWFRSILPGGTNRVQCRNILSRSFSVDLTTGDFVAIDRMNAFPAGGEDTKVRLIFDSDGRFQDVEVRQNRSWVSANLTPEPNTSWVATADKLPCSLRSMSPAPPCHHV